VEATIGRFKQVIGNELRWQTDTSQDTDVAVAIHVINRRLGFGAVRPHFVTSSRLGSLALPIRLHATRWRDRPQEPSVSRSGIVDRSYGVTAARSARRLQLELGLAALPTMGAEKGVFDNVFRAMAADPDFEYVIVDGTLVRVHQYGTGAKGGLKIRPWAGRAVG
jgi:hypothetical protein